MTLEAAFGSLFVDDRGHGLPVVLVHAFPLHSGMWDLQGRALAERYRVVAPDLPGFGRSTPGPRAPSIDDCADLCAGVLDTFEAERCVMAGCSMGGYVALAFLRRHADRLAGLVLANTRAGADGAAGREGRLAQAAEVRAKGVQSAIDGLLGKLAPDTIEARVPGLRARVLAMMRETRPEAFARMQEAMAGRPDSSPALAAADLPVCIVTGREDPLIPYTESEAMAAQCRHAELHVIEGSGHLSNLDNSEKFTAVLEGFLSKISG